jgi:hypothetical protein
MPKPTQEAIVPGRGSGREPDETPAEQQQRINNLMWQDRMKRAAKQNPGWRPPTGPTRQEREDRERRQQAAAKKQQDDREFNQLLYGLAAVFAAMSVICVAIGWWMRAVQQSVVNVDPEVAPYVHVEHAQAIWTAGWIGCVLSPVVVVLVYHFRRR